ncbi:hypothetical protein LMG27952_02737 [Paraburkholderia hiiakae]|uniref:Type VI secretion system secreted protein VgrG n=1 Tax=Paraburkholderia hiiakae TaxID=1081782 RepID=A0ABN7HRN4_9BURK|nr:hypothetical protein LMG27952_02737 [Paraburkholderia hiiakae]
MLGKRESSAGGQPMANLQGALNAISGRQAYRFDVPGTRSAAALSVVSFEAKEQMGAPTEVRIVLNHPLQLPRTDYLNLDAVFSIVADDGITRKISGFIERFSIIKTTNDHVDYEMVLKSHFARLAAVTRRKIFQHASTPDIIAAILRSHGLREHQFSFRLRGQYPKHLFRMQHQITDLAYVQTLMQKAGIYCFIQETEYGDQVVFGDDIDHYIYDPQLVVPYRETGGLEAGGVEAVTALETHSMTVPQSFIVADYNPEQAWERFKDEANVAPQDPTTYGRPYIYGTHHLDQAGAKWEAQLRHESAIAWQVVYEGESNVLALQPGRVLETDIVLPDGPKGQLIVEVTHSGARDASYTNSYKAIPADRRFRLKLEPETWAKVTGTLSARVTSPDAYTYAYITKNGHYTVRFDADFETWPGGGESVPLRLAKPFAGKLQTGMHFPALDDAEAVITCRDGDPDKPEIVAFHHHSQARDLITNDRRWLSRNVIRTQKNNKIRFEDWAGQEGVKVSTEHSGKSQLNLGYLVNNKLEYRGEGYELRTSGYGVSRAGKGLYITAYDRPGASGKQLDMQEPLAQLESALELARALAASASSAKAEPADTNAQAQMKEDFDGLKKPGLLMSTPASAGIVAGGGVQLSAQDSISTVAGKNADWSVLKRWTVAAGENISLFAQKFGIKIFAAKGPVEIQAQHGPISFTANTDINVASVNGAVYMRAEKELILESGGAFIHFKDGSITLGGPGDLFIKTITVQKKQSAQMHLVMPPVVTQAAPFVTSCKAWRATTTLASRTSLTPDASQWAASGNQTNRVAPAAPVAGQSALLQIPEASTPVQTNLRDSPEADQDSAHERKLPTGNDPTTPIALEKPVWCDASPRDIAKECKDETEMETYQGLYTDKSQMGFLVGYKFPTAFGLAYDSQHRALVATVRIRIVPVDLFKADATGRELLGPDGEKQKVPYDHDVHGRYGVTVDAPIAGGYVVRYRNGTGTTFDVPTRKRHVESVLNGHASVLILDGCSKKAACGCRITVSFRVEFLVGVNDANLGNQNIIHKTIFLFPEVARADAGAWGEVNGSFTKGDYDHPGKFAPLAEQNVIAHECGHLFNFPDEYWEWGGWVHKRYVEAGQLDFEAGKRFEGQQVWQIRSENNVMGYGATKEIPGPAGAPPSASVQPYYLEYVRRHFSVMTNKQWRIGYEAG